MLGTRFLQTAAAALVIYGVLGLLISAALIAVGFTAFGQVTSLQQGLDAERASLVQSVRTVSRTVADTATSTTNVQKSIDGARSAADTASGLANQTAGTFRQLARQLNVQVFGMQPFVAVAPQFDQSADQLQQLAISLGDTREALRQNATDVRNVGGDLTQLQRQLDAVAGAMEQPGILGAQQQLLPLQVAFYGMCLLVLLQSIFSVVAGATLFRLQRAMGAQPLLPMLGSRPSPRVAEFEPRPEPETFIVRPE